MSDDNKALDNLVNEAVRKAEEAEDTVDPGYFDRIKDKPFAITDPSVPVTPPTPHFSETAAALQQEGLDRAAAAGTVDKVDRHRRFQAFAMFGCKHMWREDFAVMPRTDVVRELGARIKEHPAVPKVMDCLLNQQRVADSIGELPAVGAIRDAIGFFVERKAKIDLESKARDTLRMQLKRHQAEIARHEMAMSAYVKNAVEAGVLKPYHAYKAGDYVLVVLQKDGEYAVSMMPLEKLPE